MVGGVKSHLESNPIPTKMFREFRQILCTPGPREPTKTKPELCLSVSCSGKGQQWHDTGVGALGATDLGMAWALLKEVAINPTTDPSELTQGWGNKLLKGTNKTLYASGPRKKNQWPHKRLIQTCPWVSRSLWRRPVVACCRVRGTEYSSVYMGPFEGGHNYPHYIHHSLASGQTTRREYSPAHQQKIGLLIYWAWPHPWRQDQFPPQSVSPIRKLP